VSYGFVGERAAAIPWQVVVHARATVGAGNGRCEVAST